MKIKLNDSAWKLLKQSVRILPRSQQMRLRVETYALQKQKQNSDNRLNMLYAQGQRIQKLQADNINLFNPNTDVLDPKQASWLSDYNAICHEYNHLITREARHNGKISEKIENVNSRKQSTKTSAKSSHQTNQPPKLSSVDLSDHVSVYNGSTEAFLNQNIRTELLSHAPKSASPFIQANRQVLTALANMSGVTLITAKTIGDRIYETGIFKPDAQAHPKQRPSVILYETPSGQLLLSPQHQSIRNIYKEAQELDQRTQGNSFAKEQYFKALQLQLADVGQHRYQPENRSEHPVPLYQEKKSRDNMTYILDDRIRSVADLEALPVSDPLMQENIKRYIQGVKNFTSQGLSQGSNPTLYAAAERFNANIKIWKRTSDRDVELITTISPKTTLANINETFGSTLPSAIGQPKAAETDNPETINLLYHFVGGNESHYQAILNFVSQTDNRAVLMPNQNEVGESGAGGECMYLSLLNARSETHDQFVQMRRQKPEGISLHTFFQQHDGMLDNLHKQLAQELENPKYANAIASEIRDAIKIQ